MKTPKLALLSVVLILPFIVAASPAPSLEVITAQVDRHSLTTDETLILTVTIRTSDSNPPQPDLPPLDGFDIIASGRGNQVSIINGVYSVQTINQYRLAPNREGDLLIAPIGVTIGGHVYQTDPIFIHVSQGQQAIQKPSPPAQSAPSNQGLSAAPVDLIGQDLHVESFVDKDQPFIGEQVIYTFRFYRAVNLLREVEFEPPQFTGFWSMEQEDSITYTINSAGRTYHVTEVQTILFPTVIGEVSIDPANLVIPGGFLSASEMLQTQPVKLDVRPLPAGAPDDFEGAVGQYELQIETDRLQTDVNDPISVRVILNGQGNIEAVPDLQFPDPAEWRSIERETQTYSRFENGQMLGSRIYQRDLIPTQGGELNLPQVQMSYFDPEEQVYKTTSSEGIRIAVSGAPEPPPLDMPEHSQSFETNSMEGVRQLKEAPTKLSLIPIDVTKIPVYWILWVLPLALVASQFGLNAYQEKRRKDESSRRASKAAKEARRELSRAKKNPDNFPGSAGSILRNYISTRLNQSIAGLTYSQLRSTLTMRGVPPSLAGHVIRVFQAIERSDYQPDEEAVDQEFLLNRIDEVITELERIFKSDE